MSLEKKIMPDLKAAMKSKDQAALRGIRAIKSVILLAKTDGSGKEITTEMEIKMLQKMVKQRQESLSIFEKQNREDLAVKEREEIAVIQKYLPAQMGADEIKAIVKGIIDKVGAQNMRDMGKVMGAASKQMAGRADGKTISAAVKELLS